MTERLTLLQRLKMLPVLFPLVGAFHIVMLIITAAGFAQAGVLTDAVPAGSCVEWALCAIIWAFVCLYQSRKAAIAYLILTVVNLGLQFLMPHGSDWRLIGSTLFPFDLLLCFFLFFYYKRFH